MTNMNERILELAKQAGLKKEHGSDREYIGDFDWRQFADLIVRECARIGELKEQDHEDYDPDISVWWYMMQHFGVET